MKRPLSWERAEGPGSREEKIVQGAAGPIVCT